jgi:uncharacterized membrane protein YhhN
MNKRVWVLLFLAALMANIVAVCFGSEGLRFFTKPLVLLILILYFFTETRRPETALKGWILLALLFSWLGDVFLLFELHDAIYFMFGLSSFLVAHIFYIVFFHSIRVREKIHSRLLLLVPVVIYYAVLISFLSPFLNEYKLPVRIYGVVISFMLLLAMHMTDLENKKAGRLMLAGALLFVLSDSILAIDKFYHSFEWAAALIMLTYGLAQWSLVEGALAYIRKMERPDS